MEKELNILAILKDEPKGTKLWSPIFGECTFDKITCDGSAIDINLKVDYQVYKTNIKAKRITRWLNIDDLMKGGK